MAQARAAPASAEKPWDTVRRLIARYQTAFKRRDLDTVVNLYASDATAVWPHLPPATGRPAIRALLNSVFKAGLSDATLQLCALTHRGDVAIEVGYYSLKTRKNEDEVEECGKYTITLNR